MKRKLLFLPLLLCTYMVGLAQFQLNTVPPLNGGNGSQGITFGLTSTQTIMIDTLFCTFTSTGATNVWVTTTDLTGPPTVSAANGWTNLGTATIPTATTAGNIVAIPLNLGYLVTPGTSYRFFINGNIGAGMAYTTGTAGVAAPFTDGTITIETGNLVGYGGPAPNPAFHPRQFNGGVKYTILGGTNDVGVASIDSPGIYCSGAQPVIATIRNYGSNQVDSVDVVWEVNGVIQGTIKHTSQLDTLNGGGSVTAQINLGSFNFPQGLNDLRVWTSNPNGVADTSNFNDTMAVKTGPALNGTFTINPSLAASSTNFTSFANLGSALNTFGVCGPVTVNVAAGKYIESLRLTNINGVSTANTITINGGDSSTTTLSHNGSSNFATLTISGTDYVTIKNLRVEATGASGDAVLINSSDNTVVENCVLWMNPTTTNFASSAIALSGSTTSNTSNANCNYNKIQNNRIVGGYYTVYMYGTTVGNDAGNKLLNNEIDSVYYYATYAYYQDSVEIKGNTMDAVVRGNLQADGIYAFYAPNAIIESNYVIANDYGLYLYNFNNTNVPRIKRKFRVVNNMIISKTDWGVYMLYADSVNFFYNSVVTSGTFNPAIQITSNTTNVIDDYDFRNNIFYSNTTEAFEITGTTDSIFNKFDNNVYYTGGATLFNISGTSYANLAAYQTAKPSYNAASLEGDPQFVSLTDLHIIGAFVDGAGDNSVPVTVDIDGETRPKAGSTNVDPGADEFDPPLCPPPSNIMTYFPSLDSITIAFDGQGNTYEIEIVAAGASQGTGTITSTPLDSIRLGGLTASTSYDVYVREACGRGDTSIWFGPVSFNTANGIPFFEDFETFPFGQAPFPKGWTVSALVSPYWNIASTTSSGATGPVEDHTIGVGGKFPYLETSTSAGAQDFISPPIYIAQNQPVVELSFWYHMHGSGMGNLEVLVDTGGTPVSLVTYTGQQHPNQTDPWLNFRTPLVGYNGKSVSIIFRGTRGTSFTSDMAIDDVQLDILPPNTAGITDVISPQLPICPGTVAPVVGVRNSGTDTLNTVTVVYNVNGVLDSVQFNGTILPGDTANVTLGNITFANGVLYDFTVYTNFPNGMADGNNNDDTLSYFGIRTGLSGAFTIDSTSAASATNFQSFEDFGDAVSNFGLCGAMTVNVTPLTGAYSNQQLILDNVQGASATNTITVNGNGATIASNSTNSDERGTILIDNTPWVTIDSLNVDARLGTYGWGIHFMGNSSNGTIRNCRIDADLTTTSTFKIPVVLSGTRVSYSTPFEGSNITVENSELIGGYFSLVSYGNTTAITRGHTFVNNIIRDFYFYGVYAVVNDSTTISFNDISRANRTLVSTFYGIYMSTPSNAIVNANAIHNNADLVANSTSTAYPMYFTGDATVGNENYIMNNIIYNINNRGTIYGIYDLGCDGTYYYNNTISLDDTLSSNTGITRAYYQTASATNTAFQNNIISLTRGGSGIKHGIYIQNTATSSIIDYNDVYVNSAGSGATYYGRFGTADEATLASWQTNTTYGTNSFDVDPRFVSLTTNNYTPTQALLNASALSVPQVTTDFFGNPRGANPDIGAIEFVPAPVDNVGLNALISPVESTDSCYGTSNDVIVELINAGGTVIDFTNSITTITMDVTGATTQTLTTTVNSNAANGGNPLAIGASVNINMGNLNMSSTGTYNFDGYIDVVNDSLRGNDSLSTTVNVAAPMGGAISGSDTICGGDTVTLTANGTVGQIQWQELVSGTWTNISGAVGNSIDVSPSSNTSYRVLACNVSPSDTITVVPVIIAMPTVVKNDPVIVNCGQTGTDTLIMAGPAGSTLEWFDAPNGGTSIIKGDTLLYIVSTAAPAGSVTDTFYVEAQTGSGPDTVMPASHNSVYSGQARGYHFVAPVDFTITGLEVATQAGPGNQNLAVLKTNGNVAWNTWNNPVVPFTTLYYGTNHSPTGYVSVNIPIKAGEVIGILGQRGTANSYGTAAPITIGGISTTIDRFIMQANLDVTAPSTATQMGDNGPGGSISRVNFTYEIGCKSARTMVIGNVDCTTGIDVLESETTSLSVSPNPSNGLFTLRINTLQAENFKLTVRDVNGKIVYNNDLRVNGEYRNDLDFTNFAKGVYYMHIQNGEEAKVEKLIIQ